ncbi:hypothetical protein [Endozoicomonas sp. 8E]|uniref:hypothetical protein n=1 Tax=Endozoicomonas sp. 8E TaxID=3035692 RepID=UPI00293913BA|nr:hypothetical protein [Endozoicomonas sp. 8E]WOG30005.1 hypothetical protein P6910_10220 [Endozoicomonas sp. 8E]
MKKNYPKNYLMMILAAALFSSAVWAADSLRNIITGRYTAYPIQSKDQDHRIWVLDSESGNVKLCKRENFGGEVNCSNFSN